MPREVTKNYIRHRVRSKRSCARGSFRTVKRGRNRIVVCCPRGHWKRGRCAVGMRAESILKPRGKRGRRR